MICPRASPVPFCPYLPTGIANRPNKHCRHMLSPVPLCESSKLPDPLINLAQPSHILCTCTGSAPVGQEEFACRYLSHPPALCHQLEHSVERHPQRIQVRNWTCCGDVAAQCADVADLAPRKPAQLLHCGCKAACSVCWLRLDELQQQVLQAREGDAGSHLDVAGSHFDLQGCSVAQTIPTSPRS